MIKQISCLKIGAVGVAFAIMLAGCGCQHEWLEADCTTPKTCAKCHTTEGEALGHQWRNATCETPKICELCRETEGKALGHNIVGYKTVVEPTCSENGKKIGKCDFCQEEFEEVIPATGAHDPAEWVVTKEATCTEPGTESSTCQLCEGELEREIAKTQHIDDDTWIVSKLPTETQKGQKVTHCTMCGCEMRKEDFEMSKEELNAIKKANSYISMMAFSRTGLIKQLEFEGFSKEASTIAVDSIGVDWNEQAAKKAESYLRLMSFSRSGLIKQLEFEGFTREQAEYGVEAVGY